MSKQEQEREDIPQWQKTLPGLIIIIWVILALYFLASAQRDEPQPPSPQGKEVKHTGDAK